MTKLGNADLIPAGKVSSTHGVKGQVKIYSYLESPENFKKYDIYDKDGNHVALEVSFVRKNQVICSLENIENKEEAEQIIGKELFILRSDLPETEEGEFYYSDLVGMDVVEQDKNSFIGKVIAVHNFGAGDILEIKSESGKNEMFSFNEQNFPNINLKKNIIEANLPEIELVQPEKEEN